MNESHAKPTLPLKSVAGALLFTVLLGPVGLLYSSTRGGVIMIVLGFIVACAKFPIPIVMAWLACCIWSVAATNKYNAKIMQKVWNN
jgi:hypothetical protein